MKTKQIMAIIILLAATSVATAKKKKVNVSQSTIEWEGKKILGKHWGMISLKSGHFMMSDNMIKSGEFVVDMNSITCTDIKDKKNNGNLIDHLKSDDFFGTDRFPTAMFKVTSSEAFNRNKAKVTGELTIKGKTESISFDVKRNNNEFEMQVEVDRTKFGIRYGSKSFFDNLGNKTINDIFTLKIMIKTQ